MLLPWPSEEKSEGWHRSGKILIQYIIVCDTISTPYWLICYSTPGSSSPEGQLVLLVVRSLEMKQKPLYQATWVCYSGREIINSLRFRLVSGSMVCSAVPSVCVCVCVVPRSLAVSSGGKTYYIIDVSTFSSTRSASPTDVVTIPSTCTAKYASCGLYECVWMPIVQ